CASPSYYYGSNYAMDYW
nr:immunoglobulin heavy chain junction region [Mus musculus]